jgi:hypothetical protein
MLLQRVKERNKLPIAAMKAGSCTRYSSFETTLTLLATENASYHFLKLINALFPKIKAVTFIMKLMPIVMCFCLFRANFPCDGSASKLFLLNSVADPDPGSGAFLTPGSGSGINNSDHISETLEPIFGLKYFNSLMWIRDPGWKTSRIRNTVNYKSYF